jgi:hypothetical protein
MAATQYALKHGLRAARVWEKSVLTHDGVYRRAANEPTPVCLENLDSDVMVMKSAENGARGHSAKMLDRAS